MYATVMYGKITGFTAPTSYEPPPLSEVIKILRVAPDEARKLFVSVARTYLRKKIDGTRMQDWDEVLAHPTWVVQESVCVHLLSEDDDETAGFVSRALRRLERAISEEVRSNAVLLGALRAEISDVGDGFFNFSMKQKFTGGHDEEEIKRITGRSPVRPIGGSEGSTRTEEDQEK